MDNMKNGGHAGTAEAENAETMDLLTGMLDAATHCGDNGGDGKEPAKLLEPPTFRTGICKNNRQTNPVLWL